MTLFDPPAWEVFIANIRKLSTRDIRKNLSEVRKFIRQPRANNRVIMTQHGEQALGLVSPYDVAVLQALDKNPEVFSLLKKECPELREGP